MCVAVGVGGRRGRGPAGRYCVLHPHEGSSRGVSIHQPVCDVNGSSRLASAAHNISAHLAPGMRSILEIDAMIALRACPARVLPASTYAVGVQAEEHICVDLPPTANLFHSQVGGGLGADRCGSLIPAVVAGVQSLTFHATTT
jgi:hypothetical protein